MNLKTNTLNNNQFKLQNDSILYLCQPSKGQDKQQRIINLIKSLKQKTQENYILVTKKPSFRLIASTHDIQSQDFNDIGQFDNFYGWKTLSVNEQQMQNLKYKTGEIINTDIFAEKFKINSYIVPTYNNEKITKTVYRVKNNNQAIVVERKPHLCGITPKNQEQMMASDLLLNDDVPFSCLVAKAGTGKTLLAITAAIQKVLVQKKYRKIVITRPIIPIGRDIGYLPGDLQDKMDQWLLPFWNNIDYIASINKANGKNKFSLQKLRILLDKQARKQFIQILPISFMRGCSISDSYVIIDQAQNTTPSQMRTIVTRIGNNTKLVLTGDIQQIDSPYLSKEINGLTMAINKFNGRQLFGYVHLTTSQRSELSKLANEILF